MASFKLRPVWTMGFLLSFFVAPFHVATSARVKTRSHGGQQADIYVGDSAEEGLGDVRAFLISNAFDPPSMTDEGIVQVADAADMHYSVRVELEKVPHFSSSLQDQITPTLTPEAAKTLTNGQEYSPIVLDGGGHVDLAGFLGNSVLSVQAVQTIRSSSAVRSLKKALSKMADMNWREAKEEELFHIGTHNTQTDGDQYTGFAHFHYVSERQFTVDERDEITALVNKWHKYVKKAKPATKREAVAK